MNVCVEMSNLNYKVSLQNKEGTRGVSLSHRKFIGLLVKCVVLMVEGVLDV